MGIGEKHQSRKQRAEIRRVLMETWDPIGIKDFPEAQDEYDMYVGPVYVILMHNGASEEDIAAYLQDIAVDRMGLSSTPSSLEASLATAKVLTALRRSLQSAEPQ